MVPGEASNNYLCPYRINPTGEMYFDGITLGPYDVLFVKLKQLMVEGRTPGSTNALRYGNWMSAAVSAPSRTPHVGGGCILCGCVPAALATISQLDLCARNFGRSPCCTKQKLDYHPRCVLSVCINDVTVSRKGLHCIQGWSALYGL